MNTSTYVVQVSQPGRFHKSDFLVTSDEKTAKNAVDTLRLGEDKLPREHRREVHLVKRRQLDEVVHV